MMRSVRVLAALGVCVSIGMWTTAPASAISVELAKKCRALMIKAHPYKRPGVKGSGSAKAERDYFADCVAHNGNMPSEPSGSSQPANPQSPKAPPAK